MNSVIYRFVQMQKKIFLESPGKGAALCYLQMEVRQRFAFES